ncbi:MAG: thioredoxin domain-containing protein [Candidatus Pacebacteria bacterium]|nr:thioredoxin domain-containing protein [Candidatus Paceibacterota bacterium]
MENEKIEIVSDKVEIINENIEIIMPGKKDNNEGPSNQKITTPMAIIIAGALIMGGILLTNSGGKVATGDKTLSEQVGVSKEKMTVCMEGFDKTAFEGKIQASVESAMKNEEGMGTPFSIIIGKNGVKSKINGAYPYEEVKKTIDEVVAGKVTTEYTGDVPPAEAGEHILGNLDTAQVVIIEYSDFECPYCARYHPTMKKIISESNGGVAWVYRHFPLTQIHQNAMERAIASECVAQIKGNDAFWKYADLLFNIVAPEEEPVDAQL